MSSSTLQFIVAGALIAAWAWMLGRPILTNLFRRSRRDSVGHFRYQQAVLGRPLDGEPFARRSMFDTIRQPLRDWRDQPIERRRLQVMLGFSFATFASLLLAIALRGAAVRVFLVMIVIFLVYLGYAASVGAAQLRKRELIDGPGMRSEAVGAGRRRGHRGTPTMPPAVDDGYLTDDHPDDIRIEENVDDTHHDEFDMGYDRADEFERSVAVAGDPAAILAEGDPFDGSEGFGTGTFEDEFFEPIPELQFAPLNLDASLIKPEPVAAGADLETEEHGLEDKTEEFTADATTDFIEEDAVRAEWTEPEPEGRVAFTTPSQPRQRPARKKARPIYIESQLDEADDGRRVVND